MLEKLSEQLARDGSLTLVVRVRPGASVSAFKDTMDDGTLKIDIAAAPEDGAANAELIRFLAEIFDVPRGNVVIRSGLTNRKKTVAVASARR